VGVLLIKSLPVIIKLLSVVGTIALIMVSGGIFAHNIEYLHHLLPNLPSLIREPMIGLAAGLIMVAILMGWRKILSFFKK
jgi:predicted DNA repair protein MutK